MNRYERLALGNESIIALVGLVWGVVLAHSSVWWAGLVAGAAGAQTLFTQARHSHQEERERGRTTSRAAYKQRELLEVVSKTSRRLEDVELLSGHEPSAPLAYVSYTRVVGIVISEVVVNPKEYEAALRHECAHVSLHHRGRGTLMLLMITLSLYAGGAMCMTGHWALGALGVVSTLSVIGLVMRTRRLWEFSADAEAAKAGREVLEGLEGLLLVIHKANSGRTSWLDSHPSAIGRLAQLNSTP